MNDWIRNGALIVLGLFLAAVLAFLAFTPAAGQTVIASDSTAEIRVVAVGELQIPDGVANRFLFRVAPGQTILIRVRPVDPSNHPVPVLTGGAALWRTGDSTVVRVEPIGSDLDGYTARILPVAGALGRGARVFVTLSAPWPGGGVGTELALFWTLETDAMECRRLVVPPFLVALGTSTVSRFQEFDEQRAGMDCFAVGAGG